MLGQEKTPTIEDMKYIEKYQEENPGDYLKKMRHIEEVNFNGFFKRKLIYKNYTDRPLLAMLSQRSLYIELNPLELPDNINKLIDALLKDELVDFLHNLTFYSKSSICVNQSTYQIKA